MIKVLFTFNLLIIINISHAQEKNIDFLKKAQTELKTAVENKNYKRAGELQDEIKIREEIEKALQTEDYQKATELKSKLENKETIDSNQDKNKQNITNPKQVNTLSGYKPPTKGKALIEFLRVTHYGWNAGVKFFIGEEYYTTSYGVSRVRVEVDPGEYLFWITWDINTDYLKATVEANQTYIVYINFKGGLRNRLDLEPISPDNLAKLDRAKKVIAKHPPKVMTKTDFDKTVKKLERKKTVAKKMKLYKKKYENSNKTSILTPEFAIPKGFLK